MENSKKKLNVLFLCTGNSCRSQMAQGWAEKLKSNCIQAFSAGVAPARLSQTAVEVMRQAGVDISKHYSKHVDELSGIDFDYVVTVCDNAKEHCPVFSGKVKMVHKSFEDPTSLITGKEEKLQKFRNARDQIRDFVEKMPENLQ